MSRKRLLLIGGVVLFAGVMAVVVIATRGPPKYLRVAAIHALSDGDALIYSEPEGELDLEDDYAQLVLASPTGPRWQARLYGDRARVAATPELLMAAGAAGVFLVEKSTLLSSQLVAYDRAKGSRSWSKRFEYQDTDWIDSLALDGDVVHVLGDCARSRGYDAKTGEERWTPQCKPGHDASIWRRGSTTLAAVGSAETVTYARADGTVVGTLPLAVVADRVHDTVCQHGETLFGFDVAASSFKLASLDPAVAPRVVADSELDGLRGCGVRGGAIIAYGWIRIAAIDVASGAVLWKTKMRDFESTPLSSRAHGLYWIGPLPSTDVLLFSAKGILYGLDATTGQPTETRSPDKDAHRHELGVASLGSAWVVGIAHDPSMDARLEREKAGPKQHAFWLVDGKGAVVGSWVADEATGDVLAPSAVADGKLWIPGASPFLASERASWKVIDLATAKPVAEYRYVD